MSTPQQIDSLNHTLDEMSTRTREVVQCLRSSPSGLSCWEIADRTNRLVHAVRPRITELKKEGRVRQVGERYERRTQRNEAVWVFVPPIPYEQIPLI